MPVTRAAHRASLHGQWSSRLAFILAVSGSAVGLGNVWRFPYLVGEHGGGAFVLVYLLCLVGVGLPIMIAEILIGRRGRRNPITTMREIGEEEGATRHWRWVGVLGVIGGLLVLSFYSVIAGWAAAYIFKGASGVFTGADVAAVGAIFAELIGDPIASGAWHAMFMAGTVFVVGLGVQRGLERTVRIMMPGLVLMLVLLAGYSVVSADFARGAAFVLEPRFEELGPQGVLDALGQAFFSLSVGMGAIMAYGAYLPQETSIPLTSIVVVVVVALVGILAALVIFPLAFAHDLDPASGPGLAFQSLPLAFGRMPGGIFVAVAFFLLLVFAAWTSAISLMEPAVAWLMETSHLTRVQGALMVGIGVWLVGLLTVLSFGPWADVRFLLGTFFDNIDFLANNILLPLGGAAIVVFAGWIMAGNSTADELDPHGGAAYRAWRFAARIVAPAAVALVLLHAVGAL